ncbi:transposase [Robbsia sp. Bb-Pol-6]|uniref:Transposase n=1 Tax=Robbsia betulipollinis TaxID=2981849 RepID=A0ABT3ZRW1_9BURK|nr:transposase [Robbsia betulipollinis]MCY0389294.1 transposase [Robbsia betulipollinis]
MDKRNGAPNRSYAHESRVEAVRLAKSVGVNEAPKRLGIPQSSVGNWVQRARGGEAVSAAGGTPKDKMAVVTMTELEAEVSRRRRELANAKLDLEIVKKAAVYFAKESQ